MTAIRVIVNGAKGRMGQETVSAINRAEDMELVAECDLGDDLLAAAKKNNADAIVDFTEPKVAKEMTLKIIESGCAGVIGTTGFNSEDIATLSAAASKSQRGILIAPNFAIGAVLMMHFASKAARFMRQAEIIELHHNKKVDAPSGTALKTASLIADSWRLSGAQIPTPVGMDAKARGSLVEGVPVHSIRLEGLLAHQEVLFGGEGQTLAIRHDTLSRASFMPGVLLGVREMVKRQGFVYGLDTLLFD